MTKVNKFVNINRNKIVFLIGTKVGMEVIPSIVRMKNDLFRCMTTKKDKPIMGQSPSHTKSSNIMGAKIF